MQVEILKNVPKAEKRQYLRVATIANKTALCYFYIGNDSKTSQFLSLSFQSGFSSVSFDTAKKLLKSQVAAEIDVIIIDLPYSDKEMMDFSSFLINRDLQAVPVIYNECQVGNNPSDKHFSLVDDVIDLSNWQYDFSTKVSFLKKTKEYSLTGRTSKFRVKPSRSVSKRIFDIVIATILIVLLLPLFLVIAVAIKLESKGPIFYNAKRAGKGFRIFSFYKFRTMIVNADKKIQELIHLNQYSDNGTGPRFIKIQNDPRITKVGRFLRNTSLDELPQLFNVLKGDMSLVGNRPLPLYEAATLTTNEFVERFMAPAGITGLWQIKKRGKSDMSTEERINLDISYARQSNLFYDLWIMAKTPQALLQKTDV